MLLFELLSDIPKYVKEQMAKSGNKIWYAKPHLYIVLFFVAMKYWLLYKRALLSIAYDKYTDTIIYRERLIHFGEKFAKESFVDNREYNFFLTHITKKEKIKAFILPFNYIGKFQ